MFSLDYFKYLLKSKKGILIFEGLVILLVFIGIGHAAAGSYLALMLALAYFLTLNIFNYVHSKKAVDTYFALPVSRKAMLSTGIIFSYVFSYLPSAIATLCKLAIRGEFNSDAVLYLGFMALAVFVLVMFNAAVYLIANNAVDGIVVLGAYTLLPLFMLIAGNIFLECFVCAYDGAVVENVIYLSPAYMAINGFMELVSANDYGFVKGSVVALVLLALLSAYVLKKEYIDRKVERAETTSKGLFAYPAVIAIYMALGMFGISSNYSNESLIDYYADYFWLYIIIFVMFIMANYLYKRKFEINLKLIATFIIAAALGLGFAAVARKTNGFYISYGYLGNHEKAHYTIRIYNTESDEMKEWIKEKSGSDSYCYSVEIDMTNGVKSGDSLRQETLDLIDELQLEATNIFYGDEILDGTSYLYTSNGCRLGKKYVECKENHNYYEAPELTIEDLKILEKDKNVKFHFDMADDEKYIYEEVYY